MFVRAICLAVFAATCLAATPASASAITENIAFTGSPENYGLTVYGSVFNPALGTLTGVTMTASGSYTPYIDTTVSDPTTGSLLREVLGTFGPGGGLTSYDQGTYTLTVNRNGSLQGAPESFSATTTVTNSEVLSTTYTAYGPYQTAGLIDVDVSSFPTGPDGWGLADDVSRFSGTLAVTFNYTAIPEPATLALLAFSLGLLTVMRRKVL